MIAAVVDREGHTGESVSNVGGIDPFFRIVAVVVIAIDRQAVGADEVLVAAVVALILGTYIIVGDCLKQSVLAGDLNLMRVGAVTGDLQTVGMVQSEFHCVTSSQVSLK